MTGPEAWDFTHQQAETRLTLAQLAAEGALPKGARITLDLMFRATADADPAAFRRKLKTFGYQSAPDPEDDDAIIAQVPDLKADPDTIWLHEERTTRLALLHGFEPDGWGFLEP